MKPYALKFCLQHVLKTNYLINHNHLVRMHATTTCLIIEIKKEALTIFLFCLPKGKPLKGKGCIVLFGYFTPLIGNIRPSW
ncbi:hypothetical protein C1H87_07325 [Flavivirga eckloniae]|uniref:Uncharacterized protein n=1 Tax=Flavivirga eckloniae TaxID=1803846 RepID=A0A2K9PN87_9FLAO|nr:hypothetical protein C1H87_07325 [Flavivirga eckloniae]